MRIVEKFDTDRPLLSIEVFPPKTEKGLAALKQKLEMYKSFSPDFISVTYGAGGSAQGGTEEICTYILKDLGVTAMAHLTCAGASREELKGILKRLEKEGVRNVIALRGDPPKGETDFVAKQGGFSHASDLIGLIHSDFDFCVACAGYPEGHVEAKTPEVDYDFLKLKIDQGAQFIVTQFFLDNLYFYRFREKIRRKGIQVPVIPGILPISNYSQVTRFSIQCGCTIPAKVMKGLNGRSDEDQEKYGLDHAVEQVEDLLDHGVDGIHLYALNKRKTVETLAPLVRGRYPAK